MCMHNTRINITSKAEIIGVNNQTLQTRKASA
jgi:hypothetical protein